MNELTTTTKSLLAAMPDANIDKLLKPLSHEILLFDSYVAGTSYIKDEAVFNEMKVGDRMVLLREPDNRFDENAILVLDNKKRKAGYIPEKDNIVFARLMDAGKFLVAKVIRLEEKGSFRQVNISIYLVDF